MQYGELRGLFKDMLNRTDCDDNLSDRFISMSLTRSARSLRIELQRDFGEYIVDANSDGVFPLPPNYLGLISVQVNGKFLNRLSPQQTEQQDGYRIVYGGLSFEPSLKEKDVISLSHFDDFIPADSDTDNSQYTNSIGDLIMWGALVYAAIYFVDSRQQVFEEEFQKARTDIQLQDDMDQLTGMAVSPTYMGIA